MGNPELVGLLLDSRQGCEVDSKDIEGCTPLMLAAADGHTAVVQQLLQRGAALDCESSNGDTALLLAAQAGHTGVVQLLIDAGGSSSAGWEGELH